MKKKQFKCSDIPVFKIIMGSCCLVCLIIGIGILVWWIRLRRAARAVVGAFDDFDFESAFSTFGDYPFDFPNGVMQEQTGTNLCVNSGSNTFDGVFATSEEMTSKEDCLNECTQNLSLLWSTINEDKDVCCMYMTNTIVGSNICSGIPGTIKSEGSIYDLYITAETKVYAISTKRGSLNPY